MESPASIPVKHSKETAKAAMDLTQLILESGGCPDPTELMSKKHRLFISILQAGEDSEDKVACPTDQALIARCLLPSGEWRKGSLTRGETTLDLWCFRAITANWCRLSVQGDTNYVSLADSEGFPAGEGCIAPTPLDTRHDVRYSDTFEVENDDEEGDDDIEDDEDCDYNDFDPCLVAHWDIKSALNRLAEILETPFNAQFAKSDITGSQGSLTIME